MLCSSGFHEILYLVSPNYYIVEQWIPIADISGKSDFCLGMKKSNCL